MWDFSLCGQTLAAVESDLPSITCVIHLLDLHSQLSWTKHSFVSSFSVTILHITHWNKIPLKNTWLCQFLAIRSKENNTALNGAALSDILTLLVDQFGCIPHTKGFSATQFFFIMLVKVTTWVATCITWKWKSKKVRYQATWFSTPILKTITDLCLLDTWCC